MTIDLHHEIHGDGRPGTAPLLLTHGGGSTITTNFGARPASMDAMLPWLRRFLDE